MSRVKGAQKDTEKKEPKAGPANWNPRLDWESVMDITEQGTDLLVLLVFILSCYYCFN